VVLAYVALAVVMTWPLATRLGTEVASDLGDPVFNCWVMIWTGGQVLRTLGGDFNAIHDYWNGNIFAPEPLTIAYSEHLTPQMLQTLPVYALSGNIVLSYNLLFLSTFVMAGVGTYLLVRELTGRRAAAFLAGVAFAYAPYRYSQISHLQVLSTYWMPLALFGFRRYFAGSIERTAPDVARLAPLRIRPLAGASAALVLQNLSCGYYLLFFVPFAAAYCLYEMVNRRLLANWRVWRSLALAAVGVVAVTWPFVSPYLELRRSGDVGVRSIEESTQFSADTLAFATAPESSRLLGTRVRAFPRGEGEGFPGFAVLAFAGIGIVWGVRRGWLQAIGASDPPWQRFAFGAWCLLTVLDLLALARLFTVGSLPFVVEGRPWRDAGPLLAGLLVLLVTLPAIPAGRRLWLGAAASAFGFFILAAIVAALLALGPNITAGGQWIGWGPYFWLYQYVPGFDGVRVPARYLMLVTLFLAALAGLGAAALLRANRRAGLVLVAAGSVAILAESWIGPMPTNVRLSPYGFELTERVLRMGDDVSPLYRVIRDTPEKVLLIEFPFAEPTYEILSTFYAGYHRRPLVNGYSGFFPEGYLRRANFLNGIPFDLEAATKALRSTNATHAIVHESAFADGRGHEVTDWLLSTGAELVGSHERMRLLRLK